MVPAQILNARKRWEVRDQKSEGRENVCRWHTPSRVFDSPGGGQ